MKKKAIVVHSGGMDSSLCLAIAAKEHGADQVLSLSFSYGQRHQQELVQAAKICKDWSIDHVELPISCLQKITRNALTDTTIPIDTSQLNTLVVGRNGLMLRLAAIHAESLGAHFVYTGVIEVESANSGYRDCSRAYVDLMQTILRIDLNDPLFEIKTPVVFMTKKDTLVLAHQLGILEYLLNETVTCYEGQMKKGCGVCPACILRNEGIADFYAEQKSLTKPYE